MAETRAKRGEMRRIQGQSNKQESQRRCEVCFSQNRLPQLVFGQGLAAEMTEMGRVICAARCERNKKREKNGFVRHDGIFLFFYFYFFNTKSIS